MPTIQPQPTRVEVALEWILSSPVADHYTRQVAYKLGVQLQAAGWHPATANNLPFAELYSDSHVLTSVARLQVVMVVQPAAPTDLSRLVGVIAQALSDASLGASSTDTLAAGMNAQMDSSWATALAEGVDNDLYKAIVTIVPPTASGRVFLGAMGAPGGSWTLAEQSAFPSAIFLPNTDGSAAHPNPPGGTSDIPPDIAPLDTTGAATGSGTSGSAAPYVLLALGIGGGAWFYWRRKTPRSRGARTA